VQADQALIGIRHRSLVMSARVPFYRGSGPLPKLTQSHCYRRARELGGAKSVAPSQLGRIA
jgi:hypothetical protein